MLQKIIDGAKLLLVYGVLLPAVWVWRKLGGTFWR